MYTTADYLKHGSRQLELSIPGQSQHLTIMVVGLGGLGVVSLTQKIRNLIAMRYPHVNTIEQRGVAQRRASTSALIKASGDSIGMTPAHADIDLLIALEPLEALRYGHLIKAGGQCLISDMRVETISGGRSPFDYPETAQIVAALKSHDINCQMLPIEDWLKAESMLPVHASSVMLGAFCAAYGFDYESLLPKSAQDAKNGRAVTWGFQQYLRQQHRYATHPESAHDAPQHTWQPAFLQ